MKTALLVIDVQQGMFDIPGHPMHDGEAAVARIASLIAQAREHGAPVCYVQHDGGPDDPFHPGKPGYPIHPAIAPRDGESITVKNHPSAFQDTDLDAKLRGAGIRALVVCGMQSEYCVDTSVRAAYERGYKVTLASDAHSTMNSRALAAKDIIAHHNTTLNGSFAEVLPVAEIDFRALVCCIRR